MNATRRRWLLYGVGSSLAGALLFAAFVKPPGPDLAKLLFEASFDARMRDYERARAELALVLAREPKNWKALWVDAYCAEKQGRAKESIERYQAVLDTPETPELTQSHRDEIRAAMARLEASQAPKNVKSP